MEDARWWGAASGTSAAEHPFSLFVRRRGSGGHPRSKNEPRESAVPMGVRGLYFPNQRTKAGD